MQHANTRHLVTIWLALSLLGAAVASLIWPAAHLGSEFLPVGNDSFYHARRILDAVQDPGAFYEFDPRIHAPEGSQLVWPWGYDFAIAQIVRAAMLVGIASDPMAILVWIPVAAVFISMGLMILLARRLSLSPGFTALAGLCVALSPLTQYLHGVGIVDHHFAEYIFVLAMLVTGLGWFANTSSARAAAVLGVTLGLAPSVHNGLFILQIPILATILLLWLQGSRLPTRSIAAFCVALVLSTLAMVLPSEPFRSGQFEFYTLSWFHLYVACGTAAASFLTTRLSPDRRGIALLLAAGAAMLLPLLRQIMLAESFLAGSIARLDRIAEMQSLPRLLLSPDGPRNAASYYSLFVLLLPLTLLYCAVQLWRERQSPRLLFWIGSICGLVMLATQFRLHYFGSFALYLPWLMLAHDLARKRPDQHKTILLATTLTLLLMYSMPLRYQLTAPMPVANDASFKTLRPVFDVLRNACAQRPGIVLADNDAGHYIRYYTECSVIANNFLLTRQQEEKIREIDRLLDLPATGLVTAHPQVDYVLVRPVDIVKTSATQFRYVGFGDTPGRLIADLLMRDPARLPASYELLDEITLQDGDTAIPYARLYRIHRDGDLSPSHSK